MEYESLWSNSLLDKIAVAEIRNAFEEKYICTFHCFTFAFPNTTIRKHDHSLFSELPSRLL